jgi:hypothetical protein
MRLGQAAAWLIVAGLLAMAAGCRTPDTASSASGDTSARAVSDDRGLLLQTGAIQLGPGVGNNAWRWQGDGHGGF